MDKTKRVAGIKNGSPVVHAIADSLMMMGPDPKQPPEDHVAAYEYDIRTVLPGYIIPISDHFAVTIRDAFDGDGPDCASADANDSVAAASARR